MKIKRSICFAMALLLILGFLPAETAFAATAEKQLTTVNQYNTSGVLISAHNFYYDTNGRLTKVAVDDYRNGSFLHSNYDYTYNQRGQLLTMTYDSGPMSRTYEYDSAGRMTHAYIEEGGASDIRYFYDANGRLSKEISDYGFGTNTTEYIYNSKGQRTGSYSVNESWYDGESLPVSSSYLYDSQGRCIDIAFTDGEYTWWEEYYYDAKPYVARTMVDSNGVEAGTVLYIGDPFGEWLYSFSFLAPMMHTDSEGYLEYVVEDVYIGNSSDTYVYEFLYSQTAGGNPFADVKEDMFCYDAVLWAYNSGITTGQDATHFNPSGACTRAQVVTFLWRAVGEPEPRSIYNPFPDVPAGKYYTKAVLWAVENGITAGFKDGTFGPNKTCTRAQIVTFLWRFDGEPVPRSMYNPFPDVDVNAYYGQAVLWAVEHGITSGFKDGTFGPNKTCTRDQIVTFLFRY